jgi:small subunit ribosomal protein S4
MTAIQAAKGNPRLTLPSYLQLEIEEAKDYGKLLSLPGHEHVPFAFNKTQVAEYYAKRGV